jgi:hypothetical protein
MQSQNEFVDGPLSGVACDGEVGEVVVVVVSCDLVTQGDGTMFDVSKGY